MKKESLPPVSGLALLSAVFIMLGIAFTLIAKEFITGLSIMGIGVVIYMTTVYIAYITLKKNGENRFINLYEKGSDKSEEEKKEFQTLRKCYELVSPIVSRVPEDSTMERFNAIQSLERDIRAKQSKMSASA